MKKSAKALIAASSAAVLLLGGGTSLAYWTDTKAVDAGSLTSGNLALGSVTCGGWVYANTTTAVVTIVPGDTVTKKCSVTLTLAGDNIKAQLAIDSASLGTSALASELDPSVTLTNATGGADLNGSTVSGAGTTTVDATVSVAFDFADATNASKIGTATLDQLNLTATQVQ